MNNEYQRSSRGVGGWGGGGGGAWYNWQPCDEQASQLEGGEETNYILLVTLCYISYCRSTVYTSCSLSSFSKSVFIRINKDFYRKWDRLRGYEPLGPT